jgi:hypothetical protein
MSNNIDNLGGRFTLREIQGLKVFENGALRGNFGQWRK